MNMKRIAAALLLLTLATAAGAAEIRGAWTADASDKDGQAYFQFNRKGSNNGRTMQLASFSGLTSAQVRATSQAPVTFTLPAEAGTVTLEGTFKDGFGAGQFSFAPNPAFFDTVRAMGVSVESEKRRNGRERDQDERLLQFALSDLSTAFIQSMRAAGYDVSLDKYLAFRIFNITPAWIRELNDLGYRDLDSDQVTAFRIHKVTPEFIRGMRELGYDDIDADKLVAMRIHRVTPDFVRELKAAGYSGIPVDKLIAMRIHGVDAEFARKMNGTK